jgi:hypothetical protein
MQTILRKPITIVTLVAVLSVAVLIVVNHTDLFSGRQPTAPPGTTFNTVQDAGGEVTPTRPESRIKPPQPGPEPAAPAQPTR